MLCSPFNTCIQFRVALMAPFASDFNLCQCFFSPLKCPFRYSIHLVAPQYLCRDEMAMPQDEAAEESRTSLQEQVTSACHLFLLMVGKIP